MTKAANSTIVLVRPLARESFADCVTSIVGPPIDSELAFKQWSSYVEAIRTNVPSAEIIQLPALPKCPDGVFVEDTCVVVGDCALVPRLGHPSRRQESPSMLATLRGLSSIKSIVEMQEPAMLDGGDVLCTGQHIFVGKSKRTNQEGIDLLIKTFSHLMPVYSVEMEGGESLHLKSLMSHLNASTLVIGDTQEGHQLWSIICQLVGQNAYQPIFIADSITANVLALPRDKFMLVQSGRDQQGVDRLQQWASDNQWKFATVHMSETIKADAALTCQSVLVGHQ